MNTPEALKRLCELGPIALATAESVTVGHLQSLIASVSGSSAYFRGGLTAYTIRQKVQLLGVNEAHAATVDCVSPQVAAEMAAAAARLFDADIGVSTTGYAEPSASTDDGGSHMYYAIWDRRNADSGVLVRSGRIDSQSLSRTQTQAYFAHRVLDELLAYLLTLPKPEA